MRQELYYKPSGGAPFLGLMITMIVGTIGGAILSIIYSLINYYNPFIYFTVIATGIFGAGCGGVAVFGQSPRSHDQCLCGVNDWLHFVVSRLGLVSLPCERSVPF